MIYQELNSTGPELSGLFEDVIPVPNTGAFGSGGDYQGGVNADFLVWMNFPQNSGDLQINHAEGTGKLYEYIGNNTNFTVKKSSAFNSGGPFTETTNVTLYPGRKYKIWGHIAGSGFSIYVKLTAHWPHKELNPDPYDKIGGCRIGQVLYYDPYSNDTIVKDYTYADGKVFYTPVYWKPIYKYYDYDGIDDNTPGAPSCDDVLLAGWSISSNSIHSMGSGAPLGYGKVTETVAKNEGRTEFKYFNLDDGISVGQVDAAWRKGILQGKKVYDKWNALKYEYYQHTRYEGATVKFAGHTADLVAQHECSPVSWYNPLFPSIFDQRIYDFPSDWIVPIRSKKPIM